MPEIELPKRKTAMRTDIDVPQINHELARLFCDRQVVLVNPYDICYRIEPEQDKFFWSNRNKDEYERLVKMLPVLYEVLPALNSIEEIIFDLRLKNAELCDAANAWFGRIMISADLINGKYMADDGRHRAAIARKLGIPVPVMIKE